MSEETTVLHDYVCASNAGLRCTCPGGPQVVRKGSGAVITRIERHAATVSKWSRLHDEAVEEAAEKAYAIAAVQGEAWTRTTTDAQQPGYLDVEVVASPSRPPSTPAAMLGEAVELANRAEALAYGVYQTTGEGGVQEAIASARVLLVEAVKALTRAQVEAEAREPKP